MYEDLYLLDPTPKSFIIILSKILLIWISYVNTEKSPFWLLIGHWRFQF